MPNTELYLHTHFFKSSFLLRGGCIQLETEAHREMTRRNQDKEQDREPPTYSFQGPWDKMERFLRESD